MSQRFGAGGSARTFEVETRKPGERIKFKPKSAMSRRWSHQRYLEELVGKQVTVEFDGPLMNDCPMFVIGILRHVDQFTLVVGTDLIFKHAIRRITPPFENVG